MVWPMILLAAWLARDYLDAIGYLIEENRVLRKHLLQALGKRRLLLTDGERRRLAVRAIQLDRDVLQKVAGIVRPETLLRWHRRLVACKYDGSRSHRGGRPPVDATLRQWIVTMAGENSTWGYGRIAGALKNLGYRVGRSTVKRVLQEAGVPPAGPQPRGMAWAEFIKTHWEMLAGMDFFTVEIWTKAGLTRYHVLFVIDLLTRRVDIAGITPEPNGAWMVQQARNLTDCFDGFLLGKRYLICDRAPVFTAAFRTTLKAGGVKVLRMPPRSPNLNAYAERFVRSIKSEALNKVIIFGEGNLRRIIREYMTHYHRERNHQGLDNALVDPVELPACGQIRCRKRLGGLLKYYHRQAA